MKRIVLGATGIEVSELCYGALPIGPLQKNIDVENAADDIAYALENGINFIDTAHTYGTYPHIALALQKSGIRPVIASKSPASTYEDMEAHVRAALDSLKLEYIDIFLLHAARASANVFNERRGALDCLVKCREKGLIRAVGISTHDAVVTREAARVSEIEIVFPLLNKAGMGILNGGLADMEVAIEECFAAGKGVYLMKALAGGNLINDFGSAMDYVFGFTRGRAPIAIGMVERSEIDFNIGYFNGTIGADVKVSAESSKKRFIIPKGLCKGCGACVKVCHSGAIRMEGVSEADTPTPGHAVIDPDVCLTCGYCVGECPQFAIRMV